MGWLGALALLLPAAQAEDPPPVHTHGQALAQYTFVSAAPVLNQECWAAYRAGGGELRAGGEGPPALLLARVHQVSTIEDRPAFTVRVFVVPSLSWEQKKTLESEIAVLADLLLTSMHPLQKREFGRLRGDRLGKFRGQRLPYELAAGPAGDLYVLDTPGAELLFQLEAADAEALKQARRDFERAVRDLEEADPEEARGLAAPVRWQAPAALRVAPVAPDLRDAVLAGAAWLQRAQDPNGGWTIAPTSGNVENRFGVSGLALQALVAAADFTTEEQRAELEAAAHRAAGFLVAHRAAATTPQPGVFGPLRAGTTAYNHLIVTRALLAYRARWGARPGAAPRLDAALTEAIARIVAWQKESGGWSYAVTRGEEPERWDSSITSKAVLALVAARAQGFAVEDEVLRRGARVLDELASEETGRIGYCLWIELGGKGGLPARLAGAGERFPWHMSESLTALGMQAQLAVREALGEESALGPLVEKQVELLAARPPSADPQTYDLYYWLAGAEVLAALGGPARAAWEAALAQALLTRQLGAEHDEALAGSWSPDSAWSVEGDRAYTTAMAVLCLAAWSSPTRLLRLAPEG